MTLEIMMETLRERARDERNEFQAKHPHYTPPPWAGMAQWHAWRQANIKLHGQGYFERFALIEAEFAVHGTNGDALLAALRKVAGVR